MKPVDSSEMRFRFCFNWNAFNKDDFVFKRYMYMSSQILWIIYIYIGPIYVDLIMLMMLQSWNTPDIG